MSVTELQPSPSPQSSSGKATLYASLVGRNFGWDNAHVWLPLCAALPYVAFGPLIVRRFASSDMMWLATYTLVRNKQYDEACEADKDLEVLREFRHRMAFPYNRELHLLFENQGAGEPSEGTMGTLGENEEPEGILEKAVMGLSWVLVPSTNMRIIRGAIEGDMRRRNISQHDIDVTVFFLAGAMEQDRYRAFAFAAVFALPAVYVLDHLEKLGRWGPVMPALLVPVSAMSFQERWLSMYIRDKPAVAAFLKERLRIS